MNSRSLVIFDAFNTLVTARRGSEGFDHAAWSGSRESYVDWAVESLRMAGHVSIEPCIVPALEQLHQAPMIAMADAMACARRLRAVGFAITVCSNWGWDLRADLEGTGLVEEIDVFVPSA